MDEERTQIVTVSRGTPATISRADWVHCLVFSSGPEAGRRLRLGELPLRVGRRAPCELVLADPLVSGQHCEVSARTGEDHAWVVDLGSTNGTFVDGERVSGRVPLPHGAVLQVGMQLLRHELHPPGEAERSETLERDLQQASRYIVSLLPRPIEAGPVRTDWVFEPSASVGGDAFGYMALDDDRFAGFLIDVSGHGVAAAVHTVSVLNVMRQRALAGVDFGEPSQVLERLNEMFGMEAHGGLFFTFWYGVYSHRSRALRYASAGHHPAFLVDAARRAMRPLRTRNPPVGAMTDPRFAAAAVEVEPGSTLYIFSDGVFEIEAADGRMLALADFTPLLLEAAEPGVGEPETLRRRVRQRTRGGPWADDFSILAVKFLP